jgi:hypothetical protein
MLTELRLQNFKPFATMQTVRLAPITLIYGPNSSGKSSLIQSLLLLKQTLEDGDHEPVLVARGPMTDLGSFESLIHGHDARLPLRLGLTHALGSGVGEAASRAYGQNGRVADLPAEAATDATCAHFGGATHRSVDLRYGLGLAPAAAAGSRLGLLEEVRVGLTDGAQAVSLDWSRAAAPVTVRRQRVAAHWHPRWVSEFGGRAQFSLLSEASRESLLAAFWRHPKTVAALGDRPVEAAAAAVWSRWLKEWVAVSSFGFPSELDLPPPPAELEGSATAELARLLAVLVSRAMENPFGSFGQWLSYLGPLRSFPERHYVVNSSALDSVGKRGEHVPQLLLRDVYALERVNAWFERMQIRYFFEPVQLGDATVGDITALKLHDRRSGLTVTASDVGFGIGQVLPLITEGIISEGRVICVEQPEIHLHPRLQAQLADFFIETSTSRWAEPNQWILETHSEALMLRIQRRIREGRLDPRQVAVHYVLPVASGSVVREMRLDRDGEFLESWPEGFFEERFVDMFDTDGREG